ncbi:hypothetical protein ACFFGQ_14710 [Rufibacter quisquiliarum]|uniref:hypothetical protein n=1 Tax=Rufibacter quisquiliarum TaxID=1549639 RepID=UPI0035EE5085
MKEEDKGFTITSANRIYEVLELIKSRPTLWLTSKTISSLQNFLNGYLLLGFSVDLYEPNQPDINEFSYWIYEQGKETGGKENIFLKVLKKECDGDEEKAFNKFFEYLEEFKKNAS